MLDYAFGLFLLTYGIIKSVLVASLLFMPTVHITGLEFFFTKDMTLAGQFIELVLLVFALFTILHGACILDIVPFRTLVESREVQYSVYMTLGLATIVFYVCVLYTTVPIQKDIANYYTYKVNLFLIGLSFVIVPFVMELVTPFLRALTLSNEMISILLFVALFVIILGGGVLIAIFRP